ncbi:MAG: ACP S-malonyltransferase [Candidatus Krumholzibacteria bacterium]
MECAILFPGQASQFVGMGKDYYDQYREVRELYKEANSTLGFDITDLSFAGDLDELTLTHNAQPAILLHSLAVLRVLERRGVRARLVSGHSLGEFSALVAAGCFRPMDALLIVRKRGELMYEAGLEEPGTMAAVIGLDESAVQKVVNEAAEAGIVVIANHNSPVQFAISGEVAAVDKAIELAREHGAKRALRLQVSGAFHSPLMEKTSGALTTYLERFNRGRLDAPWIANVTGEVVTEEDRVVDLLSRQLSSRVLWVKSMRTLAENFKGPIVEAGPGKVLTGLMKRIVSGASVYPLSSVEGLEALAQQAG